jgi:aspartokinase-like uncharacterized kinase
VVKLGGSLLEDPAALDNLPDWLGRQSEATTAIVVGGGALVEWLRRRQADFHLGDPQAHWLAIRLMGVLAECVASRLDGARLVRGWDDFKSAPADLQKGVVLVLDVESLLRGSAGRTDSPLPPESWQVTSDSLAAWIATQWPADELVVLKACLPGADATRRQLADHGIVDPYFPQAAQGIPQVRIVNLRASDAGEMVV